MNPYQPPHPGQAPYVAPLVDSARILRIASDQRMINLVVLFYFGTGTLASYMPTFPGSQYLLYFLMLLVLAAGVFYAVRMANALHGAGIAVLCAILLLVPLVGLLALLVLNRQATAELRRAGLQVGFLGVDPAHLRHLK